MTKPSDRVRQVLQDGGSLAIFDGSSQGALIHTLLMLTHDPDELVRQRTCWELGIIISRQEPAKIENRIRRLTWRLNPESGDYPIGLPELLGEIGHRAPQQIRTFVSPLLYYLDDETLQPGLLQAAGRIGENLPDTIAEHVDIISSFLPARNNVLAANAALALKRIGGSQADNALLAINSDTKEVTCFCNGAFRKIMMGDIAELGDDVENDLCFIAGQQQG